MEKPKKKWKWWHFVPFVVLAALLVGLALDGNHKAADPQATAQAVQDKSKARLKKRIDRQIEEEGKGIVPCTAVQMYREYEDNEVAADEKYKGKWVSLEGKLAAVAKDISGDPYLAFAADGYGVAQVHAELFDVQLGAVRSAEDFDTCSALDKASGLKKGQSVTVECLGQGAMLGIPRLEQCLVVSGLQ